MGTINWDFDKWRSAADAVHTAAYTLPGTALVVTLGEEGIPGMKSRTPLDDLKCELNTTSSAIAKSLDAFAGNLDKAADAVWHNEKHHSETYRDAWTPPTHYGHGQDRPE